MLFFDYAPNEEHNFEEFYDQIKMIKQTIHEEYEKKEVSAEWEKFKVEQYLFAKLIVLVISSNIGVTSTKCGSCFEGSHVIIQRN